MSIPIPYADQFECRNETLEVYASDRRGIVSYQFNNYGYRNNLDYLENSGPVGVYLGSSITSGIGVEWNNSYSKVSSDALEYPCYHFSQGCVQLDNQETLRMLKLVLEANIDIKYVVVQFIDLDRRFDRTINKTTFCEDQQENLALFLNTFKEIEQLLENKNWCFFGCDKLSHNIPDFVKNHKNAVAWNLKFVDYAGVGSHPGPKWHKMIGLGVAKKLTEQLSKN